MGRGTNLVCKLSASNYMMCECIGTVRISTFDALLKAELIVLVENPPRQQFGRDEFTLTDAGRRAAGFLDCAKCDKPVGSGGGRRVGPARDLWCAECLDNYDGPGEPDLDASSATERSEVLYRDMREAGR